MAIYFHYDFTGKLLPKRLPFMRDAHRWGKGHSLTGRPLNSEPKNTDKLRLYSYYLFMSLLLGKLISSNEKIHLLQKSIHFT